MRHACSEAIEGVDAMLDGATELVTSVGVVAVIWIIVLYGSSYFGPK